MSRYRFVGESLLLIYLGGRRGGGGMLCSQGGNFHLKVGGAKSSGNAGDPVAVIP